MLSAQLKGKKLLILAGGPNLITLVQRAKELGVYTIVTDYYEDFNVSPAKKYADEAWNVSWSDLDTLEALCKEHGVNGVTTGYSETTAECCIKLCERLGLPCYCTMDQLDFTKDKVLFKNVCRENGVPVVNEYENVESVTNLPVIVKPVDRAGSIGISVASTKQELEVAYNYAMEQSYCKKVIIEDFIHSGPKFDVVYAVLSGKIYLLSCCDTIKAQGNGFERVVQSGWLFPSKYMSAFLKKADPAIQRMIKSLNIYDGYISFSGFAMEKGADVDFVFFETGFRLSGGHMYNYMVRRGAFNVMDIFISHAILGHTKYIEFNENNNQNLKCAMVNYYATEGTITKIEGLDEIKSLEDFNFCLQLCRNGQTCNMDRAILSKLHMIHFCNESAEALANDVKKSHELYSVKDQNGQDMVYDRMDPETVRNWWKG